MEAAPDAKRRKKNKNKNKFKPAGQEGARPAQDTKPAAVLHGTAAGAAKKNKKRKAKQQHATADVDDTVAVQADAPHQRQQQAPRQAAAAGATGSGSPFAPGGRPVAGGKKGKGGSLLEQMRARLQGGRFRWLNEALYTSDGAAALAMVRKEPALMDQYHEGFREQTKGWPVQPVDQAIAWLSRRPAGLAVADLGCGDAKVAATLGAQHTVHSFDLASTAPGVVACNMAAVPLGDAAVDVAVFCLSLMGTDYGSFLEEAARIVKPGGWLWIAEVASRFVDGAGRSVLPAFEAALGALGFAVKRRDTSNTHFFVLEAQRGGGGGGKKGKKGNKQQRQHDSGVRPDWPALRPCQYKKR